ncbi:hypothetical protein [Herbaspirillum sp. CF444]|uniref:hypothetical protein n=1 Tax=Herbaspirillum sp. CF444 TaxID=1144319 RepID=UPI001ED97C70|nr:hypothetical protein [Herbaspirillum sp. CF444]
MFDSALRKLPRMFLNPLAPPYLILGVKQDDADVRAEAFSIQHVGTSKLSAAGLPLLPNPVYAANGSIIGSAHLHRVRHRMHQVPAHPHEMCVKQRSIVQRVGASAS